MNISNEWAALFAVIAAGVMAYAMYRADKRREKAKPKEPENLKEIRGTHLGWEYLIYIREHEGYSWERHKLFFEVWWSVPAFKHKSTYGRIDFEQVPDQVSKAQAEVFKFIEELAARPAKLNEVKRFLNDL